MTKVYQYDHFGFYVGITEDYGGPMPHNCTTQKPPETAQGEWGKYKFTDGAWEIAKDYRGAKGYIDGAAFIVKAPELPEGLSFYAPQLSIAERIETIERERDGNTTNLVNNILIGEKLAELTGDKSKAEDAKAEFEAMNGVYDDLLGLLKEMS